MRQSRFQGLPLARQSRGLGRCISFSRQYRQSSRHRFKCGSQHRFNFIHHRHPHEENRHLHHHRHPCFRQLRYLCHPPSQRIQPGTRGTMETEIQSLSDQLGIKTTRIASRRTGITHSPKDGFITQVLAIFEGTMVSTWRKCNPRSIQGTARRDGCGIPEKSCFSTPKRSAIRSTARLRESSWMS
jgi:hypothetical protein